MSGASQYSGETGPSTREDWQRIQDPSERRRIQNRNAQRAYRDRKRVEQEELSRIADNQEAAGGSYTAAEPKDLEHNDNPSGLPWGSYSMKHVIEAGKAKAAQSQRPSREGSVADSSATGGIGGSTTGGRGYGLTYLGLALSHHWATNEPAWEAFRRRYLQEQLQQRSLEPARRSRRV